MGRTILIYYALTDGGFAAGSWAWGTVSQSYSLNWPLEGSAGALILVATAAVLFPLRVRRESEPDPLEECNAPAVALNLTEKRPDRVKIEYLIARKMSGPQRRHVHSRVGARNWTLQRNLQKPMRWTETFRTPTCSARKARP